MRDAACYRGLVTFDRRRGFGLVWVGLKIRLSGLRGAKRFEIAGRIALPGE